MKSVLLIAAVLLSSAVFAEVSSESKMEIDHLVSFVENTPCKINRNGKYHDGSEAISHIQKKYEYFKDRINTAEQFIEYSATKSTMSGKYYLVKCGDSQPFKTREWLLKELENYREKNHT
ncbi:MAG: DUF5329 family protein [Pseudomonadota bacterium]|nr:MAG: DUF5329 family protein [Pseudomonadota bacterium]